MPNAVHLQPFIGQALVDRHRLANTIDQDLTAAARQTSHPGVFQPPQHLAQRELVELVKMPQLRRTEGVQIHQREPSFQIPQQFLVPFQLQTGVQATLHQDLIAAQRNRFLDFLIKDVPRQHVGIVIMALAVKRAEIADGSADVGIVDVPVDVVGPVRLRVETAAHGIGSSAQGHQIAALEQGAAFFRRQPLTVNRPL